MEVKIAARQCEVPESVQVRAERQMEKLLRYEPRLSRAEVIFKLNGPGKTAEGILSVDGGEPVVAQGEGGEFRPALDQMLDRLRKILRRRRSQRRDHQAVPLSEAVGPARGQEAGPPEE